MEASDLDGDKLKENKEEEEELITDFSAMFKGKGPIRKMPKLSSKQP